MNDLKLKFYGGVGHTTGASILLSVNNKNILIDCGLVQGNRELEKTNFDDFKFDPKDIDFLLLTHAHMDHIGRVPKLVKDGFKGKIISTQETKELSMPMLLDALKVMKYKYGKKTIFDEHDIEKTFNIWEGENYNKKIGLFDDCFISMKNAGHILGSAIIIASVLINGENKNIAFTGDLGNSPSLLLPDTDIPENIDYMIMESVYGDRNHLDKKDRNNKLKEAILDGIKRGGTILIPTFSIERTQGLLYEINNLIEDDFIQKIPVFLDSPLALKITNIYKKYKNDFKDSVQKEIKEGDDIFDFPNLNIIRKNEDSLNIENINSSKIILSGSGMSEGGRIRGHEANCLPDSKNTLIMVGYQSVGTLGRQISEGLKEVVIDKEKVKVKAKIFNILGYSSHKDSNNLLDFVEKTQIASKNKLKKVFVIMGEPKSSIFLTQKINDYIGNIAIYPELEKDYFL